MLELYYDGACGPRNPGGTATYAWILKEYVGKKLHKVERDSGVIGSGEGMTNNVAEYHAVLEGLRDVVTKYKMGQIKISKLYVIGDSSMVCNMISFKWGWYKGVWRPHKKALHLKTYLVEIAKLMKFLVKEGFKVRVKWIPRDENHEADEMTKRELLSKGIESPKHCSTCKCDDVYIKKVEV